MSHSPRITRPRLPFNSPRHKQKSTPSGERFRPHLEVLEDRTLLSASTYLANLVGDAGTGSGASGDLRFCINQTSAIAGSGSGGRC
jgi:hypothetical protein